MRRGRNVTSLDTSSILEARLLGDLVLHMYIFKINCYFQILIPVFLLQVARDRKSQSDVASIVKKSNSKLSELHNELQELESQIILTQGQTVTSPTAASYEHGKREAFSLYINAFLCVYENITISVLPVAGHWSQWF